jgi:putative endonuclease
MREYDFYVYMLLCADGSLYVGMTNSWRRRMIEHAQGLNPKCYTFMRRPLKLVYIQHFDYVHDAIRREKQLKGWSRKKKLALIQNDEETLFKFSRRKGVQEKEKRHKPCHPEVHSPQRSINTTCEGPEG